MSVVIPAYQAAPFIAATLDSVLAQTFADYEIIVVNDGSPDTVEMEGVLEAYQNRIRYVRQENQGPSGARNTGIRMARGEYVGFLDADDLWDPDYLVSQLKGLGGDPTIDMIYADARYFGRGPKDGHSIMEFCPSDGAVTFESLVTRRCTVPTCVSLVRRQALLDGGLFDLAFRVSEDLDMWLRIARGGGRIVYQRVVLGSYRQRPGSLSSDPARLVESVIAVLDKAARDPRTTGAQRELIGKQSRLHRARVAVEKGKQAFLRGDTRGAIRYLVEANGHRSSAKLTLLVLFLRVAPGFLRAIYRWRERISPI